MESAVDKGNPVSSETKSPTAQNQQLRGESWSVFYLLVITAEVLGMVAIILIAVWGNKWMGGYGWDGSGKMFNYHPLFMVIGFVFFYGNAAITYRVLRSTPKFTAKLIHGGLQAVGLFFAVLGLVAVFGFHNHNNIPNMYSLHSWVGIATAVLFGCQYLVGFLAFLFPKFGDDTRKAYLKIHVFFGVVILAMSIGACLSGLTEKMLFSSAKYNWSTFPAAGNVANVVALCLITFAMIIGYLLYEPSYKRVENYEQLQ